MSSQSVRALLINGADPSIKNFKGDDVTVILNQIDDVNPAVLEVKNEMREMIKAHLSSGN